jgi:hypothetical protein
MSHDTATATATATDFIEPDLAETSDEDYQSGAESSTNSLSSTVFAYEYENGRRYHAYRAGTYALPNDETEQERFVGQILQGRSFKADPSRRP